MAVDIACGSVKTNEDSNEISAGVYFRRKFCRFL